MRLAMSKAVNFLRFEESLNPPTHRVIEVTSPYKRECSPAKLCLDENV